MLPNIHSLSDSLDVSFDRRLTRGRGRGSRGRRSSGRRLRDGAEDLVETLEGQRAGGGVRLAEVAPIQQLAQPLRSVPELDTLPPVQLAETPHDVGDLLDGLLGRLETAVDDEDALGVGIVEAAPHEIGEARQVRRHRRHSQHRALGWCVAPESIVNRCAIFQNGWL